MFDFLNKLLFFGKISVDSNLGLFSEENNRVNSINLGVTNGTVQRPSLNIEPLRQEDGTYKAGRYFWSACFFSADFSDPWDWLGKFSSTVLVISSQESWKFYNSNIALMPQTDIKRNNFVMIFERAERII